MAANAIHEAVAKLEAAWPAWQIWTVFRAVGGVIWCARRRDDEGRVLNADSPDELAGYLGAEAAAD